MTNQQLYIDGELVDLGEGNNITLSIKSNLFRDITEIVSNNTYTVKLPKTVRNQRIIGHADLVQNGGSTYPYAYHTAQYFRGGVQLIKNGRAAVMSVGEDIELSIIWGIYPALQKIIDDNFSINELSNDAHIKYYYYNDPENKQTFMDRGYGYAYFNPYIQETDYEWSTKTVVLSNAPLEDVELETGAIETPTIWETCNFYIDKTKENYKCCIIDVNIGVEVGIVDAVGGNDTRLYACLDATGTVLDEAEAFQSTADLATNSITVYPGYDVSYVVVNIDTEKSTNPRVIIRRRADDAFTEFKSRYYKLRPSVTLKWVLDNITKDRGVSFNWQGEAKTLIESLAIPLLTATADTGTFNDAQIWMIATSVTESLGAMAIFVRKGSIFFDTTSDQDLVYSVKAKASGSIYFSLRGGWIFNTEGKGPNQSWTGHGDTVINRYAFGNCYVKMTITHGNGTGSVDEYIIGTTGRIECEEDKVNQTFISIEEAAAGTIDIEQDDIIAFTSCCDYGTPVGFYYSLQIYGTPKDDTNVPPGGMFPIAKNLPDIEVSDLVKFLCAITGTFPLQLDKDNEVEFASFDSIWDLSRAVDWTSRLIAQDGENKPRDMEFTIGDYAQTNWYRWKQDDKTKGFYDGCLIIPNETLSASEDVFEFPFAASDGNIIPVYTKDSRQQEEIIVGPSAGVSSSVSYEGVSDVDCEPRIMNIYTDTAGNASLRFNIRMQDIIDEKYKNLAEALRQTKVIKETMALSDVEIMEFDETRPVYLAQYGAYFAVTEIETNDDGTSDVTMLQIRKDITT